MVDINNPNEYNGAEVVIVAIVFLALTTITVLLRFYVRIFITKSFSPDDWLMLVSQVSYANPVSELSLMCSR